MYCGDLERGARRPQPLRELKAQCEKEYIEAVLRRTQWNVSRAAQLLDLQRTYLHEKMTALGITRPES